MKDLMNYEPKKNNRFLVEFPERFGIHPHSIKKISKPKFTDGKWENIRVDFIDFIGPSTSQKLFNIVEFLKKNESEDKKLFDIKIKSLDPIDVVVEEWLVLVEKVLTINFGELNYGDDGMQQIYLILKPLNCILKF